MKLSQMSPMVVLVVWLAYFDVHVIGGQQTIGYDTDARLEQMVEMMRESRKQTEEIESTMIAVIEGLQAATAALKLDVKEQAESNSELMEELPILKQQAENNSQLKREMAILKKQAKNYSQLTKEMAILKQQLAILAAALKHDEDPVQIAFSVASHSNFGPVEELTNVPYEIVYTNIGGGWSPTGNAFYVNVGGFYQLTASMAAHTGSEDGARCHIVHSSGADQIRVATMVAPSTEIGVNGISASNSVIIELQQGDFVSVQLESSSDGELSSSSSRVYSTFSGFLLMRGP